MSRLLALDLSTTQTGIAYDNELGQRILCTIKPKGERYQRIQETADRIAEIVATNKLTTAYAEDVNVGRGLKFNMMSLVALGELRGAVQYRLNRDFSMKIIYMHNATIKSLLGIQQYFGMKKQPKKEDVEKWIRIRGFKPANLDESDAAALILAAEAQEKINRMMPSLPMTLPTGSRPRGKKKTHF